MVWISFLCTKTCHLLPGKTGSCSTALLGHVEVLAVVSAKCVISLAQRTGRGAGKEGYVRGLCRRGIGSVGGYRVHVGGIGSV